MVQTCLSYKYKFENQEYSWYIDLLSCTFTRKITPSAYEKKTDSHKKTSVKEKLLISCKYNTNARLD